MKCRAILVVALVILVPAASLSAADPAPANAWRHLGDAAIGPRHTPALLFVPKLGRLVLVGGAIGRYPTGGPFPYDVLSAEAGGLKWRNQFPHGVDWSPEFGPATVPSWKGHNFSTVDSAGVVRPHMRHTTMWFGYAHDPDSNAVWAYIANRLMRLSLATWKWEVVTKDAGPGAGTGRALRWHSLCYDPVNKELVCFGGAHGAPQREGGETWVYSVVGKQWRRLAVKDDARTTARRAAKAAHRTACDLLAAARNACYRSTAAEDPAKQVAELQARLREQLAALTDRLAALIPDVNAAVPTATSFGNAHVISALRDMDRLADGPSGPVDVAGVKRLAPGVRMLRRAVDLLAPQPSPRAMSPMVYDPTSKRIVLFGGDLLDHLASDTWLYDPAARTWAQALPLGSPCPRAGHALMALPKAGKVLLVGGYTYRTSMSYLTAMYKPLPMEMWTYDVAANAWGLVKRFEKEPAPVLNGGPIAAVAAVDADDRVTAIAPGGRGKSPQLWTCRVEATVDAEATKKHRAGIGVEDRRGLSFDPAWFEQTDPIDPAAVEKKLASLPANQWVAMNPPKRLFNRDWGTQILDVDRDQILHWTGGHSAYCGTDPAHYSIATNRWNKPYASALPLELCYSASVSATVPAAAFSGRPFLPHTYRSYCYEPTTRRLLWTHEDRMWWYDPDRRDWTDDRPATPFHAERHTTVLCPTAHGVAAWAVGKGHSVYTKWYGLWLLTDPAKGTWEQIAKADGSVAPPGAYGDAHGMAYDAKRDRLLLFHFGRKDKQKVWVFDMKTRRMTVLEPAGSAAFPTSASLAREALYLPEDDLVLICTRATPRQLTLLYDPAANRWQRYEAGFAKVGRGSGPGYGVSSGIMWDPKRKLIWASNSRGAVYVLRFDRKTATIEDL